VLRFIGRRLLVVIPTVVAVTLLVFVLVEVAPGDAADALAGENPPPELAEDIRAELRLDEPFLQRYVSWFGDAVRGDLGRSYFSGQPVTDTIVESIPVTLSLMFIALCLSIAAGFVLGVVAALRPRGVVDRAVTVLSSVMLAVPSFWLALVLVLLFAVENPIFPTIGYAKLSEGPWEWLRHLLLPAIALAVNPAATLALQLKTALIAEDGSDYLLAARAKGLTQRSLLFKHSLKNAAVPVVTVLGFRITALLGGTVIIETIFVLPGLGLLAQQTALSQDVPVILGLVAVTSTFIMLVNVLVDASYGYLNPKLRV